MRLTPGNPPPETQAYIILGVGAIFLGISIIYGTFHPSDYDLRNPKGYGHPTILKGIIGIIVGLGFLSRQS
jgi:H+/Cl- antiporter ClcA